MANFGAAGMKIDTGAKAAYAFPVAREAKLQPFLENLALPGQQHIVDQFAQRGFIQRFALADMNIAVDAQHGRQAANQVNVAGPARPRTLQNLASVQPI